MSLVITLAVSDAAAYVKPINANSFNIRHNSL
jgi:hypothetical protein